MRNRLFFKPGDIVDIRQIRASEVALKRSGLFESNPAQGNAPKIAFNPPDRDGRQSGRRRQSKKSPKSRKRGRRPGDRFRGQSPDSDSRDRELDLTVDCGRYVGPREIRRLRRCKPGEEPSAAAARGATDASSANVRRMPAARRPRPASRIFVRSCTAHEYAERWRKRGQRPHLQYLAPDDGWQSRPLPQNSAPGDSAASRGPCRRPLRRFVRRAATPQPSGERETHGRLAGWCGILAKPSRKSASSSRASG